MKNLHPMWLDGSFRFEPHNTLMLKVQLHLSVSLMVFGRHWRYVLKTSQRKRRRVHFFTVTRFVKTTVRSFWGYEKGVWQYRVGIPFDRKSLSLASSFRHRESTSLWLRPSKWLRYLIYVTFGKIIVFLRAWDFHIIKFIVLQMFW